MSPKKYINWHIVKSSPIFVFLLPSAPFSNFIFLCKLVKFLYAYTNMYIFSLFTQLCLLSLVFPNGGLSE